MTQERYLIAEQGWATPAEVDATLAGVREWAAAPGAFVAWMYCGALGFAPTG